MSSTISYLLVGCKGNGQVRGPGLTWRPWGARLQWGRGGGCWQQQAEAQSPSELSQVAGPPIISNHL